MRRAIGAHTQTYAYIDLLCLSCSGYVHALQIYLKITNLISPELSFRCIFLDLSFIILFFTSRGNSTIVYCVHEIGNHVAVLIFYICSLYMSERGQKYLILHKDWLFPFRP